MIENAMVLLAAFIAALLLWAVMTGNDDVFWRDDDDAPRD